MEDKAPHCPWKAIGETSIGHLVCEKRGGKKVGEEKTN